MKVMDSGNKNYMYKYEKIKNMIDKINVEKVDSREALTILFELKNIINKEENANKDFF